MATRLDAKKLESRLAELIAEHKVPSAALGILHDGEVTEVATGIANLNTGVEATPDTIYQIGSQGKSWTTTVLMRLVDDGLVDVDVPMRKYLPGFKVADPEVSESVTLRHLLSHTSGIDGDHFPDSGRGDDCLERYVETCSALGQTHPLGGTMSYCNTGFSVIGRVTEVVTGKVWDDAMRERLFAPLGLQHTGTFADEAIMHRVAVGHTSPGPGEPLQVTPVWTLPRGCGPMGIINSTVDDVLKFAEMHLNEGKARDGAHVLSDDSARAMREPQVEVPDPHALCSHWGLGLMLFDWDGHSLYGHDGNTLGQSSYLRILPDANLALCLLANGGEASRVYRELFGEILSELAGVTIPSLPEAPTSPPDIDLSLYTGAYERLAVRYDLEQEKGQLAGTVTLSGPLAEVVSNPVTRLTMTPVDERTFLVQDEESTEPETCVFYDFEDGQPRYLHNGARANPRVGS